MGPGLGIVNHLLAGIRYEPSPNHGGVMTPTLGVIHYTANTSLSAAIKHLCDSAAQASAHVVVGVDGKIVQLVPFDKVAWHAGESSWNGKPRCNLYSIGIELVNPGYLTDVGLKAAHKHGGPVRTWAYYPAEQVRSCVMVAQALATYYGITEWVGHDDISPGRKVDPGPAWDWAGFRREMRGTTPQTLA